MKSKYARWWVIILIVVLIIFIVVWSVVNHLSFSDPKKQVKFGVTFSSEYTDQELKLNWTEVYWAIINDLKVKNIRLLAQWDMIEEGDDEFNFNNLDWMIDEAAKKNINIILAIGRRTPRWPECHNPKWIANLSEEKQDEKLLEMVKRVVAHFRKYDNITAWQVENEPFLKTFGKCPKPNEELLRREIKIVRSLDKRPIVITDTGELSNWNRAANLADIFGITMYKTVWNKFIGVWRFPWPPAYYYYKAKRIEEKFDLDKIIVVELQAEPWGKGKDIIDMSLEEQLNLFSLNDFQNNLEYVKRAGFDEAYLWGVEWWYWLKQEKNQPEFWERAKEIWQND